MAEYKCLITSIAAFSFPFPPEEIGRDDVSIFIEFKESGESKISYDVWVQIGPKYRRLVHSGEIISEQMLSEPIHSYNDAVCGVAQSFMQNDCQLYDIMVYCQDFVEDIVRKAKSIMEGRNQNAGT